MKMLVTRPEHDIGTRYLSRCFKEVIDFAKSKGVKVIDLPKTKAEKINFEGRVGKTDPTLIVLNGHGDPNGVTGHDNKDIVRVGENEDLLKGRVTYAVSCSSAKGLGSVVATSAPKTAYIGYDRPYVINAMNKFRNDPRNDPRAARYLKASNLIPISLIKGRSADESTQISKAAIAREIRSLLASSHSDPDTLEDIKDLLWNLRSLVCVGDGSAKI